MPQGNLRLIFFLSHQSLNHTKNNFELFQHLIWILRRDEETHDFRRYIGRKNVVKTDLLPMVLDCSEDSDTADVLLRLLVNLTNPVMLLYREELPKDNVGRRIFLELVEILQQYKEAFSADDVWALLGNRLQKALAVVGVSTMGKGREGCYTCWLD